MNSMVKVCFLATALWILCCVSIGCGGKHAELEKKAGLTAKAIAVLPFEMETAGEAGQQYVTCSVCGSAYKGGHIEPRAETVLSDLLFEKLKDKPDIILLTPGQSKGLWADALARSGGMPYTKILQGIGEKSGADAVLYGRIFRYEEREGRTYSVQRPASVAFDLHLVRTSDGVIMWKGRFDETQTSLMENILRFPSYLKRGGKWLTADELAEEGVDKVMADFPR
ncbi:MAG: hypothetical protein PHT49_06975 [Desulfovibrionales bacterium]|nr:hypothetical protein [Desulfovibrionales bacterium]